MAPKAPAPTKTALDYCVIYAETSYLIKDLTQDLRGDTCIQKREDDRHDEGVTIDCLQRYFESCNRWSEATKLEQQAALQDLCPGCAEKLRIIQERKRARKSLGACKTQITRLGNNEAFRRQQEAAA